MATYSLVGDYNMTGQPPALNFSLFINDTTQ